MTARRDPAGEAGTTLVELAVAMAILSIFLVAALGTFSSGWRGASDLDREIVRQADVRSGLDALVADLRQAYSGDPALTPVTAVSASSISFYSPDRSQPYRLRKITYRRTGDVLERSVTTSTNSGAAPWTFPATAPYVRLASGLQAGTIFTALDVSGTATTVAASVRRVQVHLAVDVGRQNPSAVRTWDATVALRSAS